MAAKAWGSEQTTKGIEEVFFRNESVSLCLLVNRRTKTMRVIDFRAGPSNAKRLFVMSLAQREGAEKAFTLVERDEVQTWVKLGFRKEANIPGFYKRSDAFLLGCRVTTPREEERLQSEMRLVASGAVSEDEDEPEAEVLPPEADPAHERMERTVLVAKRRAKELADKAFPAIKVTLLSDAEAKKSVAAALRTGRALTGFEAFGRDVERIHYTCTARGGFELVASAERQSCFGNAFLELLAAPKTEADALGTAASVRALCDRFTADGVVGCFGLAPSDDVTLSSCFAVNGFRRTGLLQSHIVVRGQRKDAIVWSRKLSNPADE